MSSEYHTRKTLIDAKLKASKPAWVIIPHKDGLDVNTLSHHAIEEYPTENGPADYALFVSGKLLGIIEAKKTSVGVQNVLEQAKRYASGCSNTIGAWHGFKVPFLYSSNGTQIWHADVRDEQYYARELLDFHTPDALQELFDRDINKSKRWLRQTDNDIEGLRPYQRPAIEAVEKGLQENKRNMMLAMAAIQPQIHHELPAVMRHMIRQ